MWRKLWRPCLFCLGLFLSFVLRASLPFHRFDMPAHGDCKFREEWLVQDTYKEWVMKDGNPRLARCKLKFCMKFSMQEFEEMWTRGWILCSWVLGLAHLRKSESVSGHVPVLCIWCEYHFLDTINIGNNEFLILELINSNSNPRHHHRHHHHESCLVSWVITQS